jgi:hypothetical protein
MNASASQMDFAIRFDSTPGGYSAEDDQQVRNWYTGVTFPFFPPLGPRDDSGIILPDFGSSPGYLDYGYLAIQTLLSGYATCACHGLSLLDIAALSALLTLWPSPCLPF